MHLAPLDADQVLAFVLLDLLIIIVAARVLGAVSTRLGQPRVVGEIVAGVLLGPSLLGAALWPDFVAPAVLHCDQALLLAPPGTPPSPTWCLFPPQARSVIGPIGQLGLLLFTFLAGLEIDAALLKRRKRGIALVGPGVVGVSIALGFLIGPVLATPVFKPPAASYLGFVLFLGVTMAATAFPVTVRILQEKGLTSSSVGATGIAASAVSTIVLFTTVSAASMLVGSASSGRILLTLALSAAYLAAMFLLVKPLMARLGARYEREHHLRAEFFAAIFVLLLASGYVAHLLGLTVIVGGFLTGLVLPARPQLFAELSSQLGELTRTVLLPVFLAFSGLVTDFTQLSAASLAGLALLLLGAIAAKWAGSTLLARAGGMSWAESNVIGILMNCAGLVVLVVVLVGLQEGAITGAVQVAGVVIALVTTAMTAPLFDAFARRTAPEPPPVPSG